MATVVHADPKQHLRFAAQLALRVLAIPAFMVAVALLAAGRADWDRAWLLGGLFVALMVVNLPLILWKNPGLLRERFKKRDDTKPFDRLFSALSLPLTVAMIVVGGLDGGAHGWSSPPQWTLAVGVLLHLLGCIPVVWAMTSNPHLETTVRIQTDRGHRVVSSGPYRLVRHPMYTGLILMNLGWPLVLDSLWALVPATLIVVLFVWRTSREDRTLRGELEGYEAFTARTRYRLLPGLW